MRPWADDIFDALVAADVRQVAYVPDMGHKRLIERCIGTKSMRTVVLTTEEEGVALLAGAWLGGQRGVLLMQSSGVGNCINMLSLAKTCAFPFLALVTMRGQWKEFNPWQEPMGKSTRKVLTAAGVIVDQARRPADVGPKVTAALARVFSTGTREAVLLHQGLMPRKTFGVK